MILAGDFRQCLPVVPGASRAATISHCINQSVLWDGFEQMKLTTNMRVMTSGEEKLQDFDTWTLKIGNGEMESINIPNDMIATKIHPNTKENTVSEGEAMHQFCKQIYPNIQTNLGTEGWMDGRCILAPTNKEVEMLNRVVSEMLQGTEVVLKSSDELENCDDLLRYTAEYLNSLMPSGFPPHCLKLKPNMPLMLLRNLDQKKGLCNGTKLVFLETLDNKLLKCKLSNNKEVLIPRIMLRPKLGEYPFEWHRRQFPVKLAFATTINKSQGKTLQYTGKQQIIKGKDYP